MLKKFLEWFFAPIKEPISILGVILWWEKRRIPFNFIIGIYGIISLMIFYWAIMTSGHLSPGEDAVEPLVLIAAPFLVNICYTAGWFIETFLRIINRSISPKLGVVLLKSGLAFSLFIISIPSAVWLIVRFAKVFQK